MAMNLSDRARERRIAEWQEKNRAEAEHTIALYNAQLARWDGGPCWTPLLEAALVGGFPWLQVMCEGCSAVKAVDLRVVRRPPGMALTAIAERLRCQDCGARSPRILRLMRNHDDP